MDRRRFLLTALVGALAAPLAARAQTGEKMWRIGHIFTGTWGSSWPAFVDGLSRHGWVEGKNIIFGHREFVQSASNAFTAANVKTVEELVRLNVAVIVLVGGSTAQFVQKVTRTVPIVTLSAAELAASGIVASVARPGGNITGVQSYSTDLQGRRL